MDDRICLPPAGIRQHKQHGPLQRDSCRFFVRQKPSMRCQHEHGADHRPYTRTWPPHLSEVWAKQRYQNRVMGCHSYQEVGLQLQVFLIPQGNRKKIYPINVAERRKVRKEENRVCRLKRSANSPSQRGKNKATRIYKDGRWQNPVTPLTKCRPATVIAGVW